MRSLRERRGSTDVENGYLDHHSGRDSCHPSQSGTNPLVDESMALTEVAMPQIARPDSWRRDSLEEEEGRAQRRLEGGGNGAPRGSETLTELAMHPVDDSCAGSSSSSSSRSAVLRDQTMRGFDGGEDKDAPVLHKTSIMPSLTHFYTICHLIFFAILGTLSRLGVEAVSRYPQAPVTSSVLWANVGGSLVLGFLADDSRLFREEWGKHTEQWSFKDLQDSARGGSQLVTDANKRHRKIKATMPLYIGLATGFCGSFTSFSTFMRDTFLALSAQSPSAIAAQTSGGPSHNGGYSFEAVVAIIIIHVACSIAALYLGGHIALATQNIIPVLPFRIVRTVLDPAMVLLGPGCWVGAIFLATWPPHDRWRGQVLFSLVFAPLGCLFRFYISQHLNGRVPTFPAGTFAANALGTAVLGMCFALQHSASRGLLACQILEGVMDGYCGCATTVSTWVGELVTLQRRHAYVYGISSLAVGLALLVLIIGSLLWTAGLQQIACRV